MKKKFQTLFFVKSSLITLYLALTLPIPFISIEALKIISIVLFMVGLVLIVNITSDYVEISNEKIFYKTTSLSNLIGKKSWEIFWKDIKLIKSFPTSQGSKVYYFITTRNESYLMPQRIENFEKFLSIVENKTKCNIKGISYISPIWTYKLLTYLSIFMILGEIFAFIV